MNVTSVKAHIAAIFVSIFVASQAQSAEPAQAQAPLSYTVTDLGTLGGSTSTASAANATALRAGRLVGWMLALVPA